MIFLKLGGSLITHKDQPETARLDVLARLAGEIAEARRTFPEMRLLVGHGSGSFGHPMAARHGTHLGGDNWTGFAEVWRSANRLNRLVVDETWRALEYHIPSLGGELDWRHQRLEAAPQDVVIVADVAQLLQQPAAADRQDEERDARAHARQRLPSEPRSPPRRATRLRRQPG